MKKQIEAYEGIVEVSPFGSEQYFLRNGRDDCDSVREIMESFEGKKIRITIEAIE